MKYLKEDIDRTLMKADFAKLTTMLLDGVDVNLMRNGQQTDILLESIVRKNIFMFERVLSYNFNLNLSQFPYMHHVVRTGSMSFVSLMFEEYKKQGKDFNEFDSLSHNNNLIQTAIMCETIDLEIIKYLMSSGISFEYKNSLGQTPLHMMLRKVQFIDDSLLEYLFNHKDLFKIKDNMNITPIDIIRSYALDEDWLNFYNNKKMIQFLRLKKI